MAKRKPKPEPITGQPFRDDDPLFTVIVTDYEGFPYVRYAADGIADRAPR